MDESPLKQLPDELIEAIVFFLPPDATSAFGFTCKRNNKIAFEHLVWRRHCLDGWKHWQASHEIQDKRTQPPAQVKWRLLYNERRKIDRTSLETFEELLKTQQHRISRIEEISKFGYDVKDMLVRLRDETPDDTEDVLARRYHAGVILGQVHRITAVEKWTRLANRQMISLEEVLGAYDLFVLDERKGDLTEIDQEFERLAHAIRSQNSAFEDLSIRTKAIQIAHYLRSENLLGNPIEGDYHALRNNFITMALFDEVHTSLPLQSVAIYCGVARKLGVRAKPSNYPSHVHAVIEAPEDMTLDGKYKTPILGAEPETMHMDPWRSSEEVPLEALTLRLSQMGVARDAYAVHLGASNTFDLALRTARNIMNSVQESRERQRGASRTPTYPDLEAAWYSMLWSMMILGDSNRQVTLNRRRQCLPYLAEHFQNHFPEDLGLFERIIAPMFDNEREHAVMMHVVTTQRAADENAKAPNPRNGQGPEFRVGQHFQHKRYGYEGIIVGWDNSCTADPRWISQMRVDDLPRGRSQPFYNVVADDKSQRYVAEENVARLHIKPNHSLMSLAGRYFKRWDNEKNVFISNIKDEYPED